MRNRRFLHFEGAENAQRPALNAEILTTICISLLEVKSLRVLCGGLTVPRETKRVAAHLQTVFDSLYSKLELLCDEKSARRVRRRTVSIRWEETNELLSEINVKNVNICAARESSSAKENSATEHASSPAEAAHSHARPCNAETHPATESARSQGHSNRSSTNQSTRTRNRKIKTL
jgi:hypothetical protein